MAKKDQMHPDRINEVRSRKFSEMDGLEKLKFVGKVILFLCTGGFVFPTIFVD